TFKELFVNHRCEIFEKDGAEIETTPLHLALMNKDYKTSKLLLSEGAKVNILDSKNRYPSTILLETMGPKEEKRELFNIIMKKIDLLPREEKVSIIAHKN
ncbi:hypothetical protein ACFLYA_03040, partial [Candidatus Dependentiae bacterium]